jgi:tetratricopeptide (TPR) repeat protein
LSARQIPAILSHVAEHAITSSGDEALALAKAALAARHESPADALAASSAILERGDISDAARLVALWAMGLAERELNKLEGAERHLREAIEVGLRLDDPARVAQVRSALVPVLAARGRHDEALATVDAARDFVPPAELAELEMKLALVLYQTGRFTEALDGYSRALATVELSDDRVLEARLRCNRGAALAYQGHIHEALLDCEIAERLASEHGQFYLAGGAAHNHGFAAARQGDIVVALASFARADEWYGRVGHPGRSEGVLASDRCELMMVAGLHDEARRNADLAVRSLDAVDDVSDLAEARLLLARACLAQGDHASALRAALAALEEFQFAGRDGWSALAEFVAFTASRAGATNVTNATSDPAELTKAAATADALERLGWPAEAASVRVSVAEMALAVGDRDYARTQLQIAARSRDDGRADRRANAWMAAAYLRAADGDRAGAKRAVTTGLDILADHQALLGATDLRVGASAHSGRLATIGLDMALETGGPREVLAWAERVRANALAVPPVRPPDDSPLAAALAELRRLRSEYDESRRAGDVDREADDEVRRQEIVVRDLARLVPGERAARRRFSVEELFRRLGQERQLVEFVEADGWISAVVVSPNRCRLRRLCSVAEVRSSLDGVMFALGRLAREGASPASTSASSDALSDGLTRLDDLLIRPLALTATELVIVPTGALHNVPWGGLDGLRVLGLSVATSARRWTPHVDRIDGSTTIAVITGPELADAGAEVAAVRSNHPATLELTGTSASVASSLALRVTVTFAATARCSHP